MVFLFPWQQVLTDVFFLGPCPDECVRDEFSSFHVQQLQHGDVGNSDGMDLHWYHDDPHL